MSTDLLPRKKSKLPLILGGAVAVLLVLYLVLSSSLFIKGVVLPQVGSSLGCELTVEDVSLSPFSSLTLRGVKLTPRGAETLATVAEARVRYGLFAILGGNIKVDELTLDSPAVTIVEQADGTSNLSKLLDGMPKSDKNAAKTSSAPPKLDVRNVALKNGSFKLTRKLGAGAPLTVAEVNGLEVTLDRLANGATGKLSIAAGGGFAKTIADQLHGKASGSFDLALDDKLLPRSVKGSLAADLAAATGAFKDSAGLGATLTADATATEITQIRLAFRQRAEELGSVTLSGPYDLTKKEARIAYEVTGLDRRVLAVAGAATGIDFAQTAVSASGRVDLAQLGDLVASNGRISAGRMSLVTTNGATPVVDIDLAYKISVNLGDKTALIEKVDLSVKQAGRPLVAGGLDRPMNISWDKATPGFREATYALGITGFELAPWRAVAGPSLPSGSVDMTLKVTAENDGRALKFTFASDLRDIAAMAGGVDVSGISASLGASGTVEDFAVFGMDKFDLTLTHRGARLAAFTGLAGINSKSKTMNLQASGEIAVPVALGAYPVAGVSATAGNLKVSAQYGSKAGSTNGSVDVALTGFVGRSGAMEFKDYQARVNAVAGIAGDLFTLTRAGIELRDGFEPGGTFDASGKYDLGRKSGQLEFRSVNLNQHGLAPFIANAIAPRRLVSVALDLNGSATLDAGAGSAVKGDLRISKFIAAEPGRDLPTTPLSLGLGFDAGQRGTVTDLRKLLLSFGPTPIAINELLVAGKIDMATNNAAPSSLTMKSDGLDFTALYDLFAGDGTAKKPAAPAAAKPAQAAGAAQDAEPAAVKLPFQQFALDLDIKRVHLRQVAVSNWVAKVRIDKSAVSLDPFSLALNGAPVTANVRADLGVPGFTYDVAFSGDKIPLPPFVTSFQPDRIGQIGGTVGAKVAVKGAGVTGANLQKHLTGQLEFGATNLDLKLSDVKSPLLRTIVNVVVGLPDLIRSPSLGTLASLAGLGSAGKADGWMDELSQAPIGSINAKAVVGGGKVDIQKALVLSPAFFADAKGSITLAPVLTNSVLDIPVGIALKESLGKKVGLSAASEGYSRMPDFLTVKGTVGVPKPDIAYAKLVLLAGKAGLGIAGGSAGALGEKATGLINAVTGGGAPASGTNSAAKPANALGNALGNLLGGGASRTNTTAKTNTAPAMDLLDLFKKPKK